MREEGGRRKEGGGASRSSSAAASAFAMAAWAASSLSSSPRSNLFFALCVFVYCCRALIIDVVCSFFVCLNTNCIRVLF